MRRPRRFHASLASFGCAAVILAGASAPAVAAPYTDDATVTASTSNPAVGGTVTVGLTGFDPGEAVDLVLHSTPVLLTTVTVDSNGNATVTVTLPADFRCAHYILATGRTSSKVARTDLMIGPPSACGNAGGGNSGSGNVGDGNTGYGNVGNNNSGNGNVGDNNGGNGNVGGSAGGGSGTSPTSATGYGAEGYGAGPDNDFLTTGFSAPAAAAPTHDDAAPVAVAALVGLATVGGISFVRRRRSTS